VSTWEDRNVFVTGATGLLGSTLIDRLLEQGARVVCLVRDWVPESELAISGNLARCRIVRGDLCDLDLLARTLNEHEIDTVFHLGAQTIVGTAARGPVSTFESNVRGTWLLLEACRQLPGLVQRIVVASSDKAYGAQEELPYTETSRLAGTYPYDASKSCADLIALSFHRSYGLPLAITRCGNLYGGGDLNFNRLVPGTIRSVLRGERPVIRSDGNYVRDYFYVRDAADACIALAAALPREGIVGEAFNFGNETPVSVIDMVRRITMLMERPELEPVILGEASLEIRRQYLDCTKARTLLGFAPAFDLDRGLAETIRWSRTVLGVERG